MEENRLSSNRSKFIFLIPILIGLLMAVLNLSEWFSIAVLGNISGYPFGGEGHVPYYYKTPELYAKNNAILGSVGLCLTIFSIWSFVKNRMHMCVIASIVVVGAIGIEYLHGQLT